MFFFDETAGEEDDGTSLSFVSFVFFVFEDCDETGEETTAAVEEDDDDATAAAADCAD